MDKIWKFWDEGACIEVVRNHGSKSLLAGLAGGFLVFGEVDWADGSQPVTRRIRDRETLQRWSAVQPKQG